MGKKVKIKNKTNAVLQQKLALLVMIAALFIIVNAFGGVVVKFLRNNDKNFALNKPTITEPVSPIPGVEQLNFCDHNYDGKIDLSDVALFENCKDTFDANDDGKHDLTDIGLYSANYQDIKWCKRWVSECEVATTPGNNSLAFGLDANMKTAQELQYSIDIMKDLGINKSKIWENWILRQPSPTETSWAGLDMRVNGLYEAGQDIILIIQPAGIKDGELSWYCEPTGANINSCIFKPEHEDDFGLYIESIMKRYPGKIDKIEFHNEWDSDYHFLGTKEDYVKYTNLLYDAVKKNSPDTIVSLGAITKTPLLYLAGCRLDLIGEFYDKNGNLISEAQKQAWCNDPETIAMYEKVAYAFANAKYDMVDIHLYDDPQYWDKYYQALETLNNRNRPVIVTEFGGPWQDDKRIDPYDESVQASELIRYLDKLVELPIVEAYYFRMIEGSGERINHILTGLMKVEEGKTYPIKKLNYDVFKDFISQH